MPLKLATNGQTLNWYTTQFASPQIFTISQDRRKTIIINCSSCLKSEKQALLLFICNTNRKSGQCQIYMQNASDIYTPSIAWDNYEKLCCGCVEFILTSLLFLGWEEFSETSLISSNFYSSVSPLTPKNQITIHN